MNRSSSGWKTKWARAQETWFLCFIHFSKTMCVLNIWSDASDGFNFVKNKLVLCVWVWAVKNIYTHMPVRTMGTKPPRYMSTTAYTWRICVFWEATTAHNANQRPAIIPRETDFSRIEKKIVFQISCCFLASSHLIRNRMQTDEGILLIFTHVLVSLSWFLLLYVQYTVLIMLNTCYADDVLKPNINVPSTKAIRLRTIVCCVFCVRSSITPN